MRTGVSDGASLRSRAVERIHSRPAPSHASVAAQRWGVWQAGPCACSPAQAPARPSAGRCAAPRRPRRRASRRAGAPTRSRHPPSRARGSLHATCARRRNTLAQVRRTCYSGRSDTTGRPRRVLRLMCPPGVAAEHAQLGPGGAPARCCTGAAARRAPWRTAPSLRPPRWAPARTWAPAPPVRTCGGASGTGPQHQHAARQDMHACLGLGRPRRVQALQGPRGPSAARRCGRRAARPPRLGSRSG